MSAPIATCPRCGSARVMLARVDDTYRELRALCASCGHRGPVEGSAMSALRAFSQGEEPEEVEPDGDPITGETYGEGWRT